MKVHRLMRKQPQWLRWNGTGVSGYDVHRGLRLNFPANVLDAAFRLGVDVTFHKDCDWAAALESDCQGGATIHIDVGSSLEDQRYLIALTLGYLLILPPTTPVKLYLDGQGRAVRLVRDTVKRQVLVFALQLLLPVRDVRIHFGAQWLAAHARVPVWLAQKAIDGPGWALID